MSGRLLLGAGLVLLAVACGEEKTHYTYAKSISCFKDVGKTRIMGRGQNAVRITAGQTKTFDILFLPSGAQAKAYTKQFNVPNGILRTKGNVIVYGHQTGTGPQVSGDEMDEVEKCLA
ncbi:MAG TPA: hypothetical protein VGJ40_07415 [Gaiellaceae bacterium]|jgi:hypothetical protein